ncbi:MULTISPECIES: hypothetical protein [unclassified Nocardioides]|uniref:hypothetical protein n=1 Tax=unclassified Nocardioides TaxID=2615069 RepID=UPI001054994C|nr:MULTISPECIES: hypothetical protein [unclassified Nocardioides]
MASKFREFGCRHGPVRALLVASSVACEACATFSAIVDAPCAASSMFRPISNVIAVCSSTAAAIMDCESLIEVMMVAISRIAATADSVSVLDCSESLRNVAGRLTRFLRESR